MRTVICRAWGEVEDCTVEDIAPPRPGPGEVLIAVKATAVNYADALLVAGRYQTRPALPFSPGLETARSCAMLGKLGLQVSPHTRTVRVHNGHKEVTMKRLAESLGMLLCVVG